MEKYVQKECIHHGLTSYIIEGRGYSRCVKCRTKHVSNRRRKVKITLVTEHGGRCQVCGYNKCIAALQFHHLDRGTKRFTLSHQGITRSLNKQREEAAKCILVCANCHAEIENGITEIPVWCNGYTRRC